MPDKPEQQTGKPTALNVQLVPRDHADQLVLANYSSAHVAQGIAYLDFGFIEPALLAAVARAAQEKKPLPKAVQGRLASRLALPLDALVRLHVRRKGVGSLFLTVSLGVGYKMAHATPTARRHRRLRLPCVESPCGAPVAV